MKRDISALIFNSGVPGIQTSRITLSQNWDLDATGNWSGFQEESEVQ
jgi:hypothetical protein